MEILEKATPSNCIEIRRHSQKFSWNYSDLDRRQREIGQKILAGGSGCLLVSELAPVVTLGRRTPDSDLLLSPESFALQGVQVQATDRGGFGTYHGPGQWVLFPVAPLEKLVGDPRGVRKAITALLEVAYSVGLKYRPDSSIRSGAETGVWSSRGKYAAVGIHIENGVLYHGLAVNGYPTKTSFYGLKPCGLEAPVDFLCDHPDSKAFEVLCQELVVACLERFPGVFCKSDN